MPLLVLSKPFFWSYFNGTPITTLITTPTTTPITTAVTEIEGKGWVHAKINEISEYLLFIIVFIIVLGNFGFQENKD